MGDVSSLVKSIESASKVANTPIFSTIIDRATGFKISEWVGKGELRKKLILDEYEKAKGKGIIGMQYIEYMRKTENLINTAIKSTKYIDSKKSNDIEMDNDFFWNTIEHAKTISNDEMQELVAKIIAGEYNAPGTYSMATLHILKMIGKKELELFEKVCSFCDNDLQIPQKVFNIPDSLKPTLNSLKIDFSSLQSLQILGLVLPNTMSQKIDNPDKENLVIEYFHKKIELEPTHESDFKIHIPSYYTLSDTGKQILRHLEPKFINEYFEWLKDNYKVKNYKLIEK